MIRRSVLFFMTALMLFAPVFSQAMARGPKGDTGAVGPAGPQGIKGDPGDILSIGEYQGLLTEKMVFTIHPESGLQNIHAYQLIPSTGIVNPYLWVLLSSSSVNGAYAIISDNQIYFYGMNPGDPFGVDWQVYLENQ